jgi:hypothetical protein
MREIFRGLLSGNGIRQASIVGEISPYLAEEGYCIGRFAWSGPGVAAGKQFLLALADGRQYHIEIEHAVGGSPRVVSFKAYA